MSDAVKELMEYKRRITVEERKLAQAEGRIQALQKELIELNIEEDDLEHVIEILQKEIDEKETAIEKGLLTLQDAYAWD